MAFIQIALVASCLMLQQGVRAELSELDRLRAENDALKLQVTGGDPGRVARAKFDPQLRTETGSMHFHVAAGENACFHQGETNNKGDPCVFDMQNTIDGILQQQGVMARNITEVREQLLSAVKKDSDLNKQAIAELKKEVDAGCGRHCFEGEYVKTPCSASSKTVCAACIGGSFSEGGLEKACTPCTKCVVGQYATTSCTNKADTKCKDCKQCGAGKWAKSTCKDGTSENHCAAFSVCSKAQFLSKAGTPLTDVACTNCKKCASDEFMVKACGTTTNTDCKTCTKTCPSGFVVATKCSATKDLVCEKFKLGAFGGSWYPFWWFDHTKYTGAANKVPSGVKSMLEKNYGECKGDEPYCFGRLAPEVSEFNGEIMACDHADCSKGNAYKWAFKPNNIVSHKLFRALHDHEVTKKYEVRHKNNFQPTVLRGSASGVGQDSFAFYPVNGVYSLILDDDNCYCQTTLEMGYRICTNSDSTSTFGVDMADRGCGQPTTKKSLFLFFRTTRKPHSFGLHWKQFWNWGKANNGRQRDMLGTAWGKGKSVPEGCYKSTNGIMQANPTCMGRMPEGMKEDSVEMLAIDSQGTAYKWRFKSGNKIAHAMYVSMTKGWAGNGNVGIASMGHTFNPQVLAGTGVGATQDAWHYKDCYGTKSFILDDDGCYCYTALEAGSRICSGKCNSATYGTDNLRDSYCQHTGSNKGHLWFYWRDCSKVKC